MSYLQMDLQLRRGQFELQFAATVHAGEVLAVLGPNGAGKSTLLGALTGQFAADRAQVVLDGRQVHDLATHKREISLLAQDPTLFPHLSAEANVAFGLRAGGMGKAAATTRARALLSQVDASEFAHRKPSTLSGGQAARVALARALAVSPKLLLLDEPFAALDVDAAPRMRSLIAAVLKERHMAALLVTHDPLDALVLADRVAIVDRGRIVESGPAREVLAAPSTAFAARITGNNLVAGTGDGNQLRTADGDRLYGNAVVSGPAVAVFAPADVTVHTEHPRTSTCNVARASVSRVEPRGDHARIRFSATNWADGISADVRLTMITDENIAAGKEFFVAVEAMALALHPKRAP